MKVTSDHVNIWTKSRFYWGWAQTAVSFLVFLPLSHQSDCVCSFVPSFLSFFLLFYCCPYLEQSQRLKHPWIQQCVHWFVRAQHLLPPLPPSVSDEAVPPRHHNSILAGRLLWNVLEHVYAFEGLTLHVSDPMKFLLSRPLFFWSLILLVGCNGQSQGLQQMYLWTIFFQNPSCRVQVWFIQIVYCSSTSAADPQVFQPNQSLESQCVYCTSVLFSGVYAVNALTKCPELTKVSS